MPTNITENLFKYKKKIHFPIDPMDYFLLNEHTGELRTAKPLDREALPDGAGIMKLTVRVSIFGNCLKHSF